MPRSPLWGRAGILLLVGVGGAVLGHLGSQVAAVLSQKPQVAEAGGPGGHGQGGPSGPAVVSVPSEANAKQAAERLVEVEQLLAAREFGPALLLADQLQAQYPGDPRFAAQRKRADDELRNRFRFQTFEQAMTHRNYPAALSLYDEISSDSVFKLKATKEVRVARERLVVSLVGEAEAASRLGRCEIARAYAERALSVLGPIAVTADSGAPAPSAPSGPSGPSLEESKARAVIEACPLSP